MESFERGAADDPCGSGRGSSWLVALDDARPADRLRVWLIPIVANGQNRLTWIRASSPGKAQQGSAPTALAARNSVDSCWLANVGHAASAFR